MGGIGSGVWDRWDRKDAIEEYHALDVRSLHRNGWLRPGMLGKSRWRLGEEELASVGWAVLGEEGDLAQEVELFYTVTSPSGEQEDIRCTIFLEWTRCHYGGHRPWFLCPNPSCSQCVAILYGGPHFMCRHCHGLVYDSQRENRSGRLRRRTQKLLRKLGGSGDLKESLPLKPKGMHWKTYRRLRQEAERSVIPRTGQD